MLARDSYPRERLKLVGNYDILGEDFLAQRDTQYTLGLVIDSRESLNTDP